MLVLGLPVLALEVAPRTPLLVEGAQLAGLVLALAGGALWLWATVVLVARGEGTPLPLDPPRRLVVSGPYRFVRNPMHEGLVAFFLGEALLFRSPAFVAIVVLGAAGLWAYARWREEPVLRERFGPAYDVYADSVPAWAPRVSGLGRAVSRLPSDARRLAARLAGAAGAGGRRMAIAARAARRWASRGAAAGRRWVDRARSRRPR